MSKTLENVSLIDGERYTKKHSVDGIFVDGISFYLSHNEETMAVIDNGTGDVIAELGVDAFMGEGGGGFIYVIE